MSTPELTTEEGKVIERVREIHDSILDDVKRLCELAQATGFVLTIEAQPMEPFAMGHYNLVATMRPSRDIYRSKK